MDSMTQFLAFPEQGLEFYNFKRLKRPFAPHFHKTFLLGCLTKGQRLFHANGRETVLGANRLALLPPYTIHACSPLADAHAGWLAIQADIDKYPETKKLTDVLIISEPIIVSLFQALATKAFQQNRPQSRAWHAFFAGIADLPAKDIQKCQALAPHADFSEIRQLLALAPERKISLEDLAKTAGFNKFSFLRAFFADTGITPGKYQTCMRVIKAQRLLRLGNQLSHCAFDCGFYDQSHFSRVFKDNMGITPGQYRALHSQMEHSQC